MSHIRWGEDGSHVYVIGTENYDYDCVGCDGADAQTSDLDAFLKHLEWHRGNGDCVPPYVERRLRDWKEEWGSE